MGSPITIAIPHKLGKEEAKRRIAQGFGEMGQHFAGLQMSRFEQSWDGDRLNFSACALGQMMSGRLDVHEDAIRIEVDLPELLARLAELIKGRVQRQATLLLEHKKGPRA